MTGERAHRAGAEAQDGAAGSDGAAPPAAPAEAQPLNAVALAKEVALERLQNILEWLLNRLKRYRARRGNWWEK